MQQTQTKQDNEAKFFCELHSEFQLLYFCFAEKQNRKSRMFCEKCVSEIVSHGEKILNLVALKDFKINPGNALLQAAVDENETIQDVENLLKKIEESIKSQFVIIRQNISQMRQQIGTITAELFNTLKLNDLVKQLELVKNMDCYQGTYELVQLEDQLNQISANLIKTYVSAKEKVKDNQQLIVNNYSNNLKIISNEIDSASKTSLELLNKVVTYGIPTTVFDDIYQFPQIHFQISEGKQIQYQLLFQGTRDGMNSQSYWAKCNGSSNLLTIMTSKNGNKFGGYSPCALSNAAIAYVSDPTMKSFLFQYNKREIYKLKNQDLAVHCDPLHGPIYGADGHDMLIRSDFNTGESRNLGRSYDTSAYKIADKVTHLFGAASPQLQEMKIFKVIIP